MSAEVVDGARRERQRVVEGGFVQISRRRRHHVLVHALTVVRRPVMLRAQTAADNQSINQSINPGFLKWPK